MKNKENKNKYVIICENPKDSDGELVLETYLKNADLKSTQDRLKYFQSRSKNLGKCRIAKIEL